MRRFNVESKEFSEINITPFTDVILVLLIIFMITSPLIVAGALRVKLPSATATEEVAHNKTEVYIDSQNRIFIGKKEVKPEELYSYMSWIIKQNNDSKIVIQADKYAYHYYVVQVLDAAKKAGATHLMIAASRADSNQKNQ